MEDERAYTRKEQCGADVQSGDERNEDGGTEHGEQMLDAEYYKFGLAQFTGIVYALVVCGHNIMRFVLNGYIYTVYLYIITFLHIFYCLSAM